MRTNLLASLLESMARADGDAVVMHVGERPYIQTAAGTVDLATRPLPYQALADFLIDLLPVEQQRALEEFGAVEHDLASSLSPGADRCTLVVARGGDDLWVEIRRHRLPRPVAAVPRERRALRAEAKPAPPTVRATPTMSSSSSLVAGSPEPQPPVVLPLSRPPFRSGSPTATLSSPRLAGLDRLLRLAAARGATALYVTANARPAIRIDGEIAALDGEPAVGPSEVEAWTLDLAPEPSRDALRNGAAAEWVRDIPTIGRVRCVSFRDQRGAGCIFRIISTRAATTDELGLSREIQGLCALAEGLVLVTGFRSSGKSTLHSAFLDLMNRTRRDHIVTLERQIKFAHESRGCVISQREMRGGDGEVASAMQAALRESPDVLVVEDLRSPQIVALALDAAESGHLVIGSLASPTSVAAVEYLVGLFPPERRAQVQPQLARVLRGIIAQVLLRKTGGGRLAARELLLNTPAVAGLIAEGKTAQLPLALESGRKYGMVPLNDAFAMFVQSGAVDAREAYRKAFDRQGLLNLLKREGIDTSFVERLA